MKLMLETSELRYVIAYNPKFTFRNYKLIIYMFACTHVIKNYENFDVRKIDFNKDKNIKKNYINLITSRDHENMTSGKAFRNYEDGMNFIFTYPEEVHIPC